MSFNFWLQLVFHHNQNQERREVFFIQENMLIPAQIDGAIETHHTDRHIANNTIDTEHYR